jgi:hypothetical protein
VLLSAPVFSSAHQTGGETTTKKDGRKLSIRINRNTTPDPSNNIKRHPAASSQQDSCCWSPHTEEKTNNEPVKEKETKKKKTHSPAV